MIEILALAIIGIGLDVIVRNWKQGGGHGN